MLALIFMITAAGWARASGNRAAEAREWLYQAIEAYDREDYGAAKTSLDAALDAEPDFAEAYLLKGLLEYRDGKTEEAEASLRRALRLNPRLPDKIRDKLESQAHQVEAGMTEQDFSHFKIQFHGAQERGQAWDAVQALDEVYNYLGSEFGSFPPEKIPVIIFNSQEFWDAWKAPLWLGGFFDKRDGKVRVRMDNPPGGEAEMQRRLRHEFTHAFIHQLYGKDLPMWFQEGSAQFYAYANASDSFWKDDRLEALRQLTRGAPWLDMAQIQQVIAKKNVAPGLIYLAYLESEAMVLSVAKDHGESWIPRLIQRLRSGVSFESAFRQVVGISPDEAMDELRASWQ